MKLYKAEYSDLSVLEFYSEDSCYAIYDAYKKENNKSRLFNLFEIGETGEIVSNIIRFGVVNDQISVG